MNPEKSTNTNMFPTGVSLLNPHDMYLQFQINLMQNITTLMMNAKGDPEVIDIEYGARMLIACMADKKRKKDLRDKFNAIVREIRADTQNLDAFEQKRLIMECSIAVVDKIWDYLDDMMALVKENVVYDIVNGDEGCHMMKEIDIDTDEDGRYSQTDCMEGIDSFGDDDVIS